MTVSTDAGEGLVYLTEGFHLYLYAVIYVIEEIHLFKKIQWIPCCYPL